MIHLRQNLRLSLKPCKLPRTGCEIGWQNLDRDIALQLSVERSIHLAHPPAPDQGLDCVMSELVSARQGHWIAPFYPSATGARLSVRKRRRQEVRLDEVAA
jgi:hypothetical protein